MKKLFVTFLILSFGVNAFCQLIYPLNINDMAQIKFAGTAVEMSLPGKIVVYAYQGIQQSYIVNAAHLKMPIVDVSVSATRDNFYNHQITLEVGAVKGTLLYKKNIQIDGINGVEYSYSFVKQNVKIYNYNRFVFFNEIGIDYYIMSREPLKQNDKILNDYFNSFRITIPKKTIHSL